MKMFLPKMMALALVATSSVHAVDVVMLRGSSNVLVEVQASCSDGQKDGQQAVKDLWSKSGADCDNVWSLEDEANEMKDKKFPSNSSNWKKQAYNDCARDGVDAQVNRIEGDCLSDPSQCQDLGETAAEIIVFANVCTPQFDSQSASAPDYKETCREIAYGICKGEISAKINQYCSGSNVSSSKLLDLMNKCEHQVDKMVGGDELEFMAKK